MNKTRCLALVGVFVILATTYGRAQENKIAATRVNYEGLKQEILKHRGKVVIVDFWATNCFPCMRAFPKFVKMTKDHEAKGIVVISVSLDVVNSEDPEDNIDQVRQRVDKFLTQQQAPMRNLWLDDPAVKWTEKLGSKSIPCYFVFDRQGRWVRFNGTVDYDVLENTALKMAEEK